MTALYLCAALALTYGLYVLRRYDLEQIREFDFFAKEFHAASAPLISDDETPDEVLLFLLALNKKISDPTAARDFLRFVSRKLPSNASGPPSSVREFFKHRPELEEKFLQAMAAAILAISFRSRFYGYKLRLWFAAIETNEKKEEIGASFGEFACAA